MQTPTEPKLLTWPQRHFDILSDRYDRRLIVIRETHIELIGNASGDGIDESTVTKIHFARTRPSWKAAWRVARLLANSHQQLQALISCVDMCCIRLIELGRDLQNAVEIETV
jgi:hypothetical protein